MPVDDRTKRLANPALLAKMRAAIPRDMQKADADDVVQGVFEELLATVLPDTDDGLIGLAVVTVRRRCTDRFRALQRRKQRDVEDLELGESLPEPEVPRDAVDEDLQRIQDAVEAEIARGRLSPQDRDLARMLAQGMTLAQIAEATGEPLGTVKWRASRLKAHMAKYWYLYAATAVLLVVAGMTRKRTAFEIGRDLTGETPPPAGSTEPLLYSADHYISMAQDMCDDNFWSECEKHLDEARQVDPLSERRPEVIAMRAQIAKAKVDSGPVDDPFKGPSKGPGKR